MFIADMSNTNQPNSSLSRKRTKLAKTKAYKNVQINQKANPRYCYRCKGVIKKVAIKNKMLVI